MSGVENFSLYVISAIIFVLTPGIDTIFILNKSLTKGKKTGLYSSLGICSGILVHTTFAALGLSIILAKSAIAFSLIKYLGAAYLIYIGVKALLTKQDKFNFKEEQQENETFWTSYSSGVITNVLNPKVALFFLSFFPQFISKTNTDSALPFFILGLTYAGLGIIWCFILAYFSSLFSNKLKENEKFNFWLNKTSSLIFILMGLKIALDKK
ncbi:LysE family translocator [Flavobacterium flavipallidum]|uniref:LysE family translocator n=1 Tax=Flavobacterium flavipallidum TaxID=3139140 RepID=A0ABU9HR86_9FLAO